MGLVLESLHPMHSPAPPDTAGFRNEHGAELLADGHALIELKFK